MVRAAVLASVSLLAAGKTVKLATFDGAEETTLPFVPVNDPVMGGQSRSTFQVDGNKGIFEGEVKVVTFLGSPGFCNLEAPGYGQSAVEFPDISGTDGITINMDQTLSNGLSNWDVSLQTQSSKKATTTGDAGWQANFEFKSGQTSYFVPYTAFSCSSRGRKLTTCGDLPEQLNELTQVGIGSDGVAGKFRVELTSIEATASPLLTAAEEVRLATFDGVEETSLSWKLLLDPVMGGASTGDFTVTGENTAKLSGRCNIVKSLNAPGFAKLEGTGRTLVDVTGSDSLLLKLRSATPQYQGFKLAFGAPGIPSPIIFEKNGAYKTEFFLADTQDWQTVEVPMANFSRDTSDYTGRCDSKDPTGKQHFCCSQSPLQPSKDEVCVEQKYLSQINDLAIWAEGVEGDFDLEIEWIGAKPASLVV